jgi:hypothetical protein
VIEYCGFTGSLELRWQDGIAGLPAPQVVAA